MNNKEYDELIKQTIKEENVSRNMLISFISGGFMGVIGQLFVEVFMEITNCSLSDAYLFTFMALIVIGSILTGLGVFDKVLSVCKCGLIVPSTGFANTMTSSAMDSKSEGFVKGVGATIFKLTGSIILYGVLFGVIFGFIRSMIL